jgi:hypothetical protein
MSGKFIVNTMWNLRIQLVHDAREWVLSTRAAYAHVVELQSVDPGSINYNRLTAKADTYLLGMSAFEASSLIFRPTRMNSGLRPANFEPLTCI